MWCFHASGHGKDKGDGLGGGLKTALAREQLKGIDGHKLDCVADCVAFLSEKFRLHREKLYEEINEVRRFFWEVKVGDVNRSKCYDCLPIEGTRKLHCFHGFSRLNPTLLNVREMCCFCPSCIDEDWENCSNLEYTGPWTLHNVHPRKPADVVDYVDAIGHGQGILDQSDEGTIADLVEVGDFFAVEAEWPNDYSAEFWILQCTKPLHVLADMTTDAYGETHEEGSSVSEGMWY
ncbi:hypothetical protein R1sor_008506 [Riccia sorocarpa]|uniref:Uncharacterized protein n=1 Tax=Riccia sorocarpa TaxID=122646 RepID=A0ABD3HX81_9MARC